MWDFIAGSQVDKDKSFYCGDAAGRPKTTFKKADFSADDMVFARNVGLEFHTPESCFLGKAKVGVQKDIMSMFKKTEKITEVITEQKETKTGQ